MRIDRHNQDGTGCQGACCLRVTDLGVTIGDAVILSHVNLHIHCGEIMALIGPNGAGKSTLLKSILGQATHTGTISFEWAGGHPDRPRVGYVPQSPNFQPGDPVSVLDLFAAAISRWPVFLPIPKSLRQRVLHCLALVHSEGLIDKPMGSLSGGELQRVLLAMALEPIPQILILDEPLSGVDVEGARQLMEMLDAIRQTIDLSILFTTHDFSTLTQYADQVVLLNGTILASGTPNQVLSSPAFGQVFHLTPRKGGWQ